MELIRKQVMHDSRHLSANCAFHEQLHSQIKRPSTNYKKQIATLERDFEFLTQK